MKYLILIILFISAICLTPKYYQECSHEIVIEDNLYLTANKCRNYDSEDGFCCYLHYKITDGNYYSDGYYTYYYYYYYYRKKENETKEKPKIRSLQEPQRYCYGISQEGFNNIQKVIDELSEESGIDADELQLDCGKQNLKYNLLNMIILLLIFFIL